MEKRKENNLTLKAFCGAVLAILISVGFLLAANAAMPFRQFEPRDIPPREALPDVFQNVFLLHTVLSLAMLILSFYLFFIYLKDYLQLKSGFTFGLLLAIFSFMLFAVTANPFLHVFFGVYGRDGIFQSVPYLFATISLGILVWVSSK
jgi:type III secretory pathway component EscU